VKSSQKGTAFPATGGGPFRLLKYFIISGIVVISLVTFLLTTFLYSGSVETVRESSENYARLLAENLNYNIYNGFYAPLKARGREMDLTEWDQFGSLDALIKDSTYGLNIELIKIIGKTGKILYSTDYDLIGRMDANTLPVKQSLKGKRATLIRREQESASLWHGKWLADTYYPLREGTGHYWMLGNIYGVIQITQDVTGQYVKVQRSIIALIVVSVILMAFLFIMLTLIVRRGEKILMERAKEQEELSEQLQQSEKLASIGQMIATIAHEIRNPLGIIRSSAEMLVKKSDPDPDRIKKLSEVIVEEATRLSAILTDFLEFARPRSPDLKTIDLRDVISKVRNNLGQTIAERRIKWIDKDLNGFQPLVLGDFDLLYQAFLNVAINAFEAIDRDGTLMVAMQPDDARVRVDFDDDGPGVNEEDLAKMFTPFFTTHEMGTGLGLSVVHNIIAAHGGEIVVESEEGQGLVFSIFLPKG
jgi:two-component system sensor histidine kinase HydH